MLTKKERDEILRKIYEGGITVAVLPVNLYRATAKKLNEGVRIGAEGGPTDLIAELEENIYVFSGAKTYTQVKDISSLIVENGELVPWSKFKKLAIEKYELYNVDYLASEYETAIGQAQSAVKWNQIQQDAKAFPYLQRKAVMDANTSPECVMLNDIVAPVGDPFWRTRSPLTHFRCRCILEAIDKYADVKLSSRAKINASVRDTEHINPLFKGNPGIDKVIFNESHPYFDIEPKDKKLAKKNFNLPI